MRPSWWQVVALRLLFLTYVWFTASYCLLCYIPFTYQQIHVGELLPWITGLVKLHSVLFWPVFAGVVLTILPDLKDGPSRHLARGLLGCGTLAGVAIVAHPLLPHLANDFSSLAWCLLSLTPLLWLGAIDWFHGGAAVTVEGTTNADNSRNFRASLQSAVYLTATYFAIGVFRISSSKALHFGWSQWCWVLFWSLFSHLVLFVLAFALLDLATAAGALFTDHRRGRVNAFVSTSIVAMFVWLALHYVVFPPLSFRGWSAAIVATVFSASLVVYACGISVRIWGALHKFDDGGLALLLAPLRIPQLRSRKGQGLALAALAVLAWIMSDHISRFDWGFVLQKIAVMLVWAIAFAVCYTGTPKTKRYGRRLTYGAGTLVLGVYMGMAGTLSRRALENGSPSATGSVLEQYSGYDISFRLVDEMFRRGNGAQPSDSNDSFYAFLAANTHVPRSAHIAPIDIRMAGDLAPLPHRRPHIFFFVIDSLRRDYLSSYNSKVKFTPALNAFARESVAFTNAFTHYGGTGLSEPSIWVGGLMLHQQYTSPFAPMNSLQKLMEANHYREWISRDSILQQVVPPSPNIVELDRHIGTMSYDLCRTLQELTERLSSVHGTDSPVFVYTQAQNLHVSVIDRQGRSVPRGVSFPPEFDGAYASRVQKVDACLGDFLNTLKANGIYDDSIIVVTSDHGDSLGEMGRWGHAYTLFPEIVRIPLLVHLPVWLREGVKDDPDAPAFLTDLTPSLYYLLGERPVVDTPLFGRPLFTATLQEQQPYLRDSFVLVSSYAPVYGLLTHHGHSLYIADGVNYLDYAYEINSDGSSREVSVADAARIAAQEKIREQVSAIATFYKLRQ